MKSKMFLAGLLMLVSGAEAARADSSVYRDQGERYRDESSDPDHRRGRLRRTDEEIRYERERSERYHEERSSGQGSSEGEIGTLYDGRQDRNTAAGDWDPTGNHSDASSRR